MTFNKNQPTSLALFCKVVDNYGDIGICWRLSRQLQQEHGVAVTLWVDDLASFKRLCPQVAVELEIQQINGVSVRHWQSQDGEFAVTDVADLVIEFFGCDIPDGYIAAMARSLPQPVWLNLEGLSAEKWVEGCHRLPSPHPRLPITKHFFFPGFTPHTGGLLLEASLLKQRRQFQSDPLAMADWLAELGLTEAETSSVKVSLFCYSHAPIAALFEAWQESDKKITCLIPDGVAVEAVRDFLGQSPDVGVKRSRGSLTVCIVPFLSQVDYDKLLWACDLNFVRGEDSFVRAQWADKPFVWHIYPQANNLHLVKLRAFFSRYCAELPNTINFFLRWNGADVDHSGEFAGWPALWTKFEADLSTLAAQASHWQQKMQENGDLASNILQFAVSLRSAGA